MCLECFYLAALTGDGPEVEAGGGGAAHLARDGLEVHTQLLAVLTPCRGSTHHTLLLELDSISL